MSAAAAPGHKKYYSAFTPLDIPGCSLWLDASDPATLTLSGSNVLQWRDKSSNAYTFIQGTTANQPTVGTDFIGGRQVISYTASQSMRTTSYVQNSSTATFFVVTKVVTSSFADWQFTRFFMNATAGYPYFYIEKNPTYGKYAAVFSAYGNGGMLADIGSGSLAGQPRMLTAYLSGNSGTNFINQNGSGTSLLLNNTTSGLSTGITNGTIDILGSADGQMAEMIMFDRLLTTAQYQIVEGYLSRKWFLAGSPTTVIPFSPTSISGCALWLDAADTSSLTLSGSNVTQWRDKSGNGNNATVQIGNTTYSSNSIVFTGAQMLQTPLSSVMPTQSFFCVLSSGSSAANMSVVSIKSPNLLTGYNYRINSNQQIVSRYDSTATLVMSGSTITQGTRYLYNATLNSGGSSFLYANGTQTGSNTTTPTISGSNATVGIGAYYYPTVDAIPAGYFTGNINELIIFNNVLTTSQRQQIEGYLANKWGLQTSLPSTHPYSAATNIPSTHPYYSIPPVTREFAPIDISNCTLWIDAADRNSMALSGSSVTQLNDKSGNGYHLTQSTVASAPILSNNYITFSSDRYLNIPQAALNNTTTYSIFFVFNPISTSNWIFVKQQNGVNTYNALGMTFYPSLGSGASGTSQYMYWRPYNAAVRSTNNQAVPTSTVSIMEIVYDNANVMFYRNGVLSSTTASAGTSVIQNATSADNFTLGAYISTGIANSGVTNFQLSEMMFFSRNLIDSERQQIEGYLAKKWGFVGSPAFIVPFYPTNISGCALWLDATDTSTLSISGSTVTQWRDKSSNAYSGTLVNSPTLQSNAINGLQAVQFNGTNQYINYGNVLNIGTSSIYVFVVSKFDSTANAGIVGKTSARGGVTGRWALLRSSTDGGLGYLFDNSDTSTSGFISDSSTSSRLLTLYWDRSNTYLLQNGSQIITRALSYTSNFVGSDPFYIAAYPDSTGTAPLAGYFYNGKIGEVLIYLSSLTTTQRQQVEGYLARKWGLQSSLPSTHPYALTGFPSTHPYISRNPATTVFNPRQISGCALWLDAADYSSLTLSGSNVTQWRDKSGNGKNASTYQSSPTLSNNLVTFNGTQGLQLSSPFFSANTQNVSIAIVWNCTTGSTGSNNFQSIIEQNASVNGTWWRFMVYGNGFGARSENFYGLNEYGGNPTPVLNFPGFTVGTPNLTFITQTSTDGTNFTINNYTYGSLVGTQTYTGAIGAPTLATIGYNTNTVAGGEPFRGTISEILLFNTALSTIQRQQIEGYLAWKWGLNITPFIPTSISGCALWLDAADSNTLYRYGVASLNQYVTTSAQSVSYTGTITSVSSMLGGTCFMNGASVNSQAGRSGVFAPSATSGRWYAFCIDGGFCKVVLVEFVLTGATLTVRGISAGYRSTNFLSDSNSGATNDTYYAGYTSAAIATSSSTQAYGVANFSMNFTSSTQVTTIARWNDKSGNGRNTSTATGTPVLSNNSVISKGGVFFNGSSYFTGPFSYSSNRLSWFVVGSIDSDSASSYGRLLSFTSSGTYDYDNTLRLNALCRNNSTTEVISFRNGATIGSGLNITYGSPFIYSGVIDGTNMYPYLNGTLGTTAATSGNFGFTTYGISSSVGLNIEPNKGHIFEVIVYTGVFTTIQRQQIEGYLAKKWGLTSSLPSSHPYANSSLPTSHPYKVIKP